MIGQRIGTYRIVRELGRGGMGSVYEAVREDIGRRVAIKVLLAQHSADPQVAARFFLEARAVSIINHPGLVSIHEHGMTPDGLAYLVMEFLDGKTLRQRIAEGPPLLSASLPLIAQAAQALAATHQKQIVHRVRSDRQKPSRKRDLGCSEKTAGKLRSISHLGLVLDGTEQRCVFSEVHGAQSPKHRLRACRSERRSACGRQKKSRSAAGLGFLFAA